MTHARISTPVPVSDVGLRWRRGEDVPDGMKPLHVGAFEGMLTTGDGYLYWWHVAVEKRTDTWSDESLAAYPELGDFEPFDLVTTVREVQAPSAAEQAFQPGLLHSRKRITAPEIWDAVLRGDYDDDLPEYVGPRDVAVAALQHAVRALEADMCGPVDRPATSTGPAVSTPRALAEAWPDDDWTGTRKEIEALLPGHTGSAILSALQRGPYASSNAGRLGNAAGQAAIWRRVPGQRSRKPRPRKRG